MSKLQELIQQYCPDGVETFKLNTICDIYDGTHQTPNYTESGIKFASVENIANPYNTDKYISLSDYEKYKIKPQIDDVLMTRIGSIGVCYVVDKNEPLAYYVSLALIRPKNENISSKYLKYYIESVYGRKELYKRTLVNAVPIKINKEDIGKIKILVPPLEVQAEIVRILDTFTEVTKELQTKLEEELTARQKQYEYYRDSLLNFNHKIGGVITLDKISENCDSKRKPITASKRQSGNIPYYGASGIVDYVKDYIFDGNYLLISEDGANLLARNTPIAFSISGKTWVNNHAHILKFDEPVTQKYVEIYLNSIDLSPYISGGAQPKLNQQNLNKIEIPLPPLDVQQRIVDVLDNFEKICTDLKIGLPAEISARQQQYEYYRDKLLTFRKKDEL